MKKTTRESTPRILPDGIPRELANQVEVLEWIIGIKRKLPNLPNGGLKVSLEENLEALLSGDELPSVVVAALEHELEGKTRELERIRLLAEDDLTFSQNQSQTNTTTAQRIRKVLWYGYLIILHTLVWNFLTNLCAIAPN
jgi:hypothetical protein